MSLSLSLPCKPTSNLSPRAWPYCDPVLRLLASRSGGIHVFFLVTSILYPIIAAQTKINKNQVIWPVLLAGFVTSDFPVTQSCPTLCDLCMGCSPLGSSVHGILQARILEWVATSFSRGSSWPRDRTRVSHIVGRCFTHWATRETATQLFISTWRHRLLPVNRWASPKQRKSFSF